MSSQDLPVGRRRNDETDLVQPAGISSAPPWDSVLDRLANLERSHADLARMVNSIHEALPPEIAAATGRGLALGSPIDPVSPTTSFGIAAPVFVTPPPPLPERFEPPGSPNLDPFSQTFEAPDPWGVPQSFFQPPTAPAFPAEVARPKRRLLGSRRAAREAQARIAAEFAAAAAHPGFFPHDPATSGTSSPPPPPPGFGADHTPDVGPPAGWGNSDVPPPPPGFGQPEDGLAPPPPPGFATDLPNDGYGTPAGWSGSPFDPPVLVPPPPGFATDLAEPDLVGAAEPNISWGEVADLSSPSDFVFDQPAIPPPPGFAPAGSADLELAPPPPPPGYGGDFEAGPPPPPPPGFASPPQPAMAPAGWANPMHASSAEVFGDVQDVNSLVAPMEVHQPPPESEGDPRFLAGTGIELTSYTSVPLITPDFFARSGGRGRR